MINNPIIHRELLGMLRTKKAIMIQLFVVAVLASLVIFRWPSDAIADHSGKQAQQILQLFGYGLMVSLLLLAPVFPATSIVNEKRSGTLALLLNSPMSPWALFFGKLVGVAGFVIMLILLSTPAAAACMAMGGVNPWQMLSLYGVLLLLALQYATLGLLVSSYASTPDSALRMTYGLVLLLAVITLGPYQFFQGTVQGPLADLIIWVRCLSPLPAVMQIMGHGAIGSQGITSETNWVMQFSILASGITVVAAFWTASRFGSKIFDKSRSAGKVTDEQSANVQIYRRIMYLWFFDPQRRSGLIGPLTNPVRVKEFRTRKFGRAHWILRLFGVCFILSLGLILMTTMSTMNWGAQTLGGIVVLLQMALIVLVTPSLASGMICGEIETQSWQLLQMTPLSTFTIVKGKLTSAALTLIMMLTATMPAYATLYLIDNSLLTQIVNTLISLCLTAAMALLLTAAVSSMVSKTASATAISYTLLVGIFLLPMLIWLGLDAPFTGATVEKALIFSPLAGALKLIEMPQFAGYNLIPLNWYIQGAICVIAFFVMVIRTWKLSRPR
ncbi:MAG: ABC transporter permease subunit [Phycisphaeraceae bacterium]|nr:ABC transporter permease subunit [Phycisphaeraceae bacterium]